MESAIPHLREILIFLGAAGILVPLFQKFHIAPILGFLIAGVMLGPHGAGKLADIWEPARAFVITGNEGVSLLANLGIVFLLFMIGLELSFERLSQMRTLVFGLGSLQVVATSTIIGITAWAFGAAPPTAMILGLGFALSSTAIVMQLLSDGQRLGSSVGRVSFAILLFQDMSVVLLLFIIGFVGPDLQAGLSFSLVKYLGKSLIFAALSIGAIILIGRIVLRPLFHLAAKSRNRNSELFIAATLLAVFSIAAGTQAAGLSMGLGAFLAGLLLAETEYRHDIEITIDPFKGLLLGLFFMSVGMNVDLKYLFDHPVFIPGVVIGLFALKALILYPFARAFGMPKGRAVELGLLLGQAGEFAFVVLSMASSNNMLPASVAQFMLIVTSLSMMVTPVFAHVAYRIRKHYDGADLSPYGPAAQHVDFIDNHVILAGYGRMGRLLRDVLAKRFIPVIAIDSDHALKHDTRAFVLTGDATDGDTLLKAGLRRAIAVAVVMDKVEDAKKVVEKVRELAPNMLIVARARDSVHAADLYQRGATVTIPDVIEGSLHVAQELMVHLGIPEDAARQTIDQQRLQEAHTIETAKML